MNMREEFEKWYQVQDGAPDVKELRDIFKLDEDGEYYFLGTRLGWRAWQAAWQAAQPKWIKCSEQMPPVNTWVMVVTDTGRCYTAYFNELLNSWDDGSVYSDIKGVVGWCNMTPPFGIQPPNPPEE